MREGRSHPDPIVETQSLGTVVPPDPHYQHHIKVGKFGGCALSCALLLLPVVRQVQGSSNTQFSNMLTENPRWNHIRAVQFENQLFAPHARHVASLS